MRSSTDGWYSGKKKRRRSGSRETSFKNTGDVERPWDYDNHMRLASIRLQEANRSFAQAKAIKVGKTHTMFARLQKSILYAKAGAEYAAAKNQIRISRAKQRKHIGL